MPLDSRQRILEHIKQSGQASVAELSEALALTPVTIRHHLDALRKDGLIVDPVARHKPGPGRPEMMYRLTPEADTFMPRNYGELCRCLIQTIAATRPQELQSVLAGMGRELGSSAGTDGRADAAELYLEQRGYFPSLERGEGLIMLQLANCPYLEVAENARSLCHFDKALIEALFGQKVVMQGRIVDQEPVCSFQIGGS